MFQAAIAVITAALILGFTATAYAADPPSRFASGPFLAPVKVHRMDKPVLLKQCARYGKQPIGCTMLWKDRCDIYIATVLPSGWYPGVLAHEEAHCRGWPANHPP